MSVRWYIETRTPDGEWAVVALTATARIEDPWAELSRRVFVRPLSQPASGGAHRLAGSTSGTSRHSGATPEPPLVCHDPAEVIIADQGRRDRRKHALRADID